MRLPVFIFLVFAVVHTQSLCGSEFDVDANTNNVFAQQVLGNPKIGYWFIRKSRQPSTVGYHLNYLADEFFQQRCSSSSKNKLVAWFRAKMLAIQRVDNMRSADPRPWLYSMTYSKDLLISLPDGSLTRFSCDRIVEIDLPSPVKEKRLAMLAETPDKTIWLGHIPQLRWGQPNVGDKKLIWVSRDKSNMEVYPWINQQSVQPIMSAHAYVAPDYICDLGSTGNIAWGVGILCFNKRFSQRRVLQTPKDLNLSQFRRGPYPIKKKAWVVFDYSNQEQLSKRLDRLVIFSRLGSDGEGNQNFQVKTVLLKENESPFVLSGENHSVMQLGANVFYGAPIGVYTVSTKGPILLTLFKQRVDRVGLNPSGSDAFLVTTPDMIYKIKRRKVDANAG